MTKAQFRKLAKAKGMHGWSRSLAACELVMVKGKTPTEAAKAQGLHTSSVTRPLKRLQEDLPRCNGCGQVLP